MDRRRRKREVRKLVKARLPIPYSLLGWEPPKLMAITGWALPDRDPENPNQSIWIEAEGPWLEITHEGEVKC